ncbi:MAG: hypothetical protein ABR538_12325 [Candidatus Binatia bacterium]
MTRAGALTAGVILFMLPFLQSGLFGSQAHGGAPHMNHEPRHGGRLLMLGDRHLEIVEEGTSLELYVSDAERRPLKALAASIAFDDGERQPLLWSGYRLVVERPTHYAWADYRIHLAGDPLITIRLPEGGVSMPGEG